MGRYDRGCGQICGGEHVRGMVTHNGVDFSDRHDGGALLLMVMKWRWW
jgi:hypothetical protein